MFAVVESVLSVPCAVENVMYNCRSRVLIEIQVGNSDKMPDVLICQIGMMIFFGNYKYNISLMFIFDISLFS